MLQTAVRLFVVDAWGHNLANARNMSLPVCSEMGFPSGLRRNPARPSKIKTLELYIRGTTESQPPKSPHQALAKNDGPARYVNTTRHSRVYPRAHLVKPKRHRHKVTDPLREKNNVQAPKVRPFCHSQRSRFVLYRSPRFNGVQCKCFY